MGREAPCVATHGDQSGEGTALLETDELRFRGPFRLRIPLKEITAATAADGVLRLEFPGGPATFELGRHAERWAHAILHPPTLLDKLEIRPGSAITVVDVDDATFAADLGRAEGVDARAEVEDADVILVAVEDRAELARIAELRGRMRSDAALWAIRPKGVPRVTEDEVRRAGLDAGLVDVKTARFSATHTAEKFVVPRDRR